MPETPNGRKPPDPPFTSLGMSFLSIFQLRKNDCPSLVDRPIFMRPAMIINTMTNKLITVIMAFRRTDSLTPAMHMRVNTTIIPNDIGSTYGANPLRFRGDHSIKCWAIVPLHRESMYWE